MWIGLASSLSIFMLKNQRLVWGNSNPAREGGEALGWISEREVPMLSLSLRDKTKHINMLTQWHGCCDKDLPRQQDHWGQRAKPRLFEPLGQRLYLWGKDEQMTMRELRAIARDLGMRTTNLRKADLIRAIQLAEGNFDCFGKAEDYCDQLSCLFRKDCLRWTADQS